MTSPELPKKAVIILRVSSKKQREEGKSLVEQERICRQICERRGYVPIEPPLSLTKPSSAAGSDTLEAIMKGIHQGAEAIVVADLDRLSREPENLFMLEKLLNSLDIILICADGDLDTAKESGWMSFFFKVLTAAGEKRRIRERAIRSGRARAKTKAWRGGIAPLGYNYNKNTGLLEVNPTEAELVKRLFHAYRTYKSVKAAIKKVGWVNKQGQLQNSAMLSSILRNPRYCGKARYGEIDQCRPEEAIVTEQLFSEVQKILDKKMKLRKPQRREITIEAARNMVVCHALLGGFSKQKIYELYREISSAHAQASSEAFAGPSDGVSGTDNSSP